MVVPRLAAGMEKRLDGSRLGVDAREVRALVEVALLASEGEVRLVVRPAVLPWDDVLELVGDERLVFLAGAAVFAAILGPLPDELADGGRDHADDLLSKTERALA